MSGAVSYSAFGSRLVGLLDELKCEVETQPSQSDGVAQTVGLATSLALGGIINLGLA
jgi:hypothetical protein